MKLNRNFIRGTERSRFFLQINSVFYDKIFLLFAAILIEGLLEISHGR